MRILCYHSYQSGLEPVLESSSVKSVIPVHVRMTHGKSSIMYFLLCILTAHFGDIPLRRQFCNFINPEICLVYRGLPSYVAGNLYMYILVAMIENFI